MWRTSSLVSYINLLSLLLAYGESQAVRNNFVQTKGIQFVMNGKPLYFNGFNSYWLMYMASNPSTRYMVTATFKQASNLGMNVARTWAFSDGGYRPLQISPGFYNEDMFKGLDFVMSEANKYGIKLMLTLVNNWLDYGGKRQYVQWANETLQNLKNDDDFFTNPIVKGYYKNHMKAIFTRVNSITGVAYKDDPTIFAWELMNEPRSLFDPSGKAIQDWVAEMAAYAKSIDNNHLLDVGMEGFYGESMPEKKQFNPGYGVGTDFITNNRIPQVDFTTIHIYQWVKDNIQDEFEEKWIQAHINDSQSIIEKPLMVTEFGKSSKSVGYNVGVRDKYFEKIFNSVYYCARGGGPCGGALFWQVVAEGMEQWGDTLEVILEKSPSTDSIINQQSRRLSLLD